jgi:signal transduction histidine kinase/ActR/RegA family two-component response regulator
MPHLLLVDDDQQITKSYSEFFELEGWVVATAASGEEALRVLTPVFDAVVLDQQMGGISGLQTLERIRGRRELDGVCVVLLTAYGTVPTAVHSMRLGAYAYLSKSEVGAAAIRPILLAGIAKQKAARVRRELLGSLAVDRIVDRICSVLAETVGREGAFLILTDADGKLVQARAIPDVPTNRLIETVASSKMPTFIQRIRKDRSPVFATGAQVAALDPIHADAQCFLATYVPGPEDRIAGFIGIEGKTDSSFHEGWEEVLTYLADLTGIALEIAAKKEEELAFYRKLPDMVGVLSHRLSTPLQVITNQVSLAEREVRDPPNLASALTIIRKRASEIGQVVEELSRLVRFPLPAGRSITAIDLGEFVQERAEQHRGVLAEEGIRLYYSEPPGARIQISTDPNLLGYALDCLMDNARESIEAARQEALGGLGSAGVVRDDSVRVNLALNAEASQFSITVCDTGTGVAQKHRGLLFLPLFTTKSTKNRDRGTGLYSARMYMTSLGGTVEFLSDFPGPGAMFTIRLPLRQLTAMEAAASTV